MKLIANNTELSDPSLYINRELSLLAFNRRVLLEAEDTRHPLLERLKFIAIFSSNMDEFFMIRVAGLLEQIDAGVVEITADGMSPNKQIDEIRKKLLPLYEMQSRILMHDIFPKLAQENIVFHKYDSLSSEEKEKLREYFIIQILPILTPLGMDPGHPFPRLLNRSLNIVFSLKEPNKKGIGERIVVMQAPSSTPRLVPIKRESGFHFVLLEDIIDANSDIIFPGFEIESSHSFRVTRDADIEIAEDEADDLMTAIAEQASRRRWGGAAVRLEVNPSMPQKIVGILTKSLELDEEDVYYHDRPLNMPDFLSLLKLDVRNLKDAPFSSRQIDIFNDETKSVFRAIREKDYLVHHPYDSFSKSVLTFLNTAAEDKNVIAIKITLYRTGGDSPVIEALKKAAANGKQVMAFVELKARFDEENNITWAKALENVGAHVVYGVIGLKTHCKIAMVVRKESSGLRSYLHLSTGNYNLSTSRIYTDIGYFTARQDMASDAIHLFNFLTAYSQKKDWQRFIVAPINLREKILGLIDREIKKHTPENPGFIFAKMNAITDEIVIRKLYEASQKGVKIRLLVRGVTCLRPNIKGISENIEVRSIIGRFLEHSRIFYFKNGGEDEEVYLSSADWMQRNLNRRVELMFPILDHKLRHKLVILLDTYWMDNKKSWKLNSDGVYEKIQPKKGEGEFSIQEFLLKGSRGADMKNGVIHSLKKRDSLGVEK